MQKADKHLKAIKRAANKQFINIQDMAKAGNLARGQGH